jgi:hypothetical protein
MGPFATATELYERIGEPLPSDLARAQAFLEDAANLIRSYTGQVLTAVANDSVILPATTTNVLYLPESPVTSITSVTEQGVLQASNTYTFSELGALRRVSASSSLIAGNAWIYGATVVYSHGYATTDPEFWELRNLTIEMAGRAMKGPNPDGPDFGNIFPEAVGQSPMIFLTQTETQRLMSLMPLPVG